MIFFLDTQYDSMFMSIFMPVPQSFDYSGFLVSFEKKKKCEFFKFVLFSRHVFSYLGHVATSYEFEH